MRLAGLILVLIFAVEGWSQTTNPSTGHYLSAFLATTGAEGRTTSFSRYLEQLEGRKARLTGEREFLQYVFNATHKRYLKRFASEATFASLFDHGTYNCLTGTTLYSLILYHFNIPHQVIETNYHIFILASFADGDVLIEATDRANGLVENENEIASRIENYRTMLPVQSELRADLTYYHFGFDLYNPVTPEELTGLLYYNLAIRAYNRHNLQHAVTYLGEAISRYSSPRIEALANLLLITVHENNTLSTGDKSAFKKKLQTIRYRALPVVASLQP